MERTLGKPLQVGYPILSMGVLPDVRHPGGQSHRLSTSHHDEELADEVTE